MYTIDKLATQKQTLTGRQGTGRAFAVALTSADKMNMASGIIKNI